MDLALTAGGSFIVGVLGGLLGVGGGTFLVPFLIFAVGLSPQASVGVSLFCVIGTSLGGTHRALRTGRANVGLSLVLEPFLVVSAVAASLFAQQIDGSVILGMFGGLMLALAIVVYRRRGIGPGFEVAPIGPPQFADGVVPGAIEGNIAYRPQRLPVLVGGVSLVGVASGLFGIGGGTLTVPMMTGIGKVPLRAATATSTLTMSVTGAVGGAVYLAHGSVALPLVAASMLGVVPGGQIGARLQAKIPERLLRVGFAALALLVAVSSGLKASGALS